MLKAKALWSGLVGAMVTGLLSAPWVAPRSASFSGAPGWLSRKDPYPEHAAASDAGLAPGGDAPARPASAWRDFAARTFAWRPFALPPAAQLLLDMQNWQGYIRTRFDYQGHRPLSLANLPEEILPPSDAGSEDAFEHAYVAAMRSPQWRDRQVFLDGFWSEHIASRLNEEEAALQMVAMRLAYMHWQPGQVLPLDITSSLRTGGAPVWPDGTPVGYARFNALREALPGSKADELTRTGPGLAAFWFTPQDHAAGPAIVLFRGTNVSAKDVLAYYDPNGLAEDLDWNGVGFTTFWAHHEDLQRWVRTSLQQGRKVVLVGHSLGGALAGRLLASLDPKEQAQVRLVSYSPAGLEALCTEAIVTPPEQNVIVLDSDDLVPSCGARHPPAQVLETLLWRDAWTLSSAKLIATHTRPQLAAARLGWSAAPNLRTWRAKRIYAPPAILPEQARRYILLPVGRLILSLSGFRILAEPPVGEPIMRASGDLMTGLL